MKESFGLALKEVLRHEGGYVNHPADPGGATNKGVTQATYNGYRKSKGQASRSVKQITEDELKDIYQSLYWNKIRGDDLPVGVDLAVFDFAVNSGPARAAKFLQSLVGVTADGVIGPKSIEAANSKQFGLVDRLCDERLRFLQSLKTWATFGKGWSNRVSSVRTVAKSMRKEYAEVRH